MNLVSIFFLLSIVLNGAIISNRFPLYKNKNPKINLVSIFLTGSICSITLIYILSSLLHSLFNSLVIYSLMSTFFWIKFLRWDLIKNFNVKLSRSESFFFLSLFILSWYLFSKSFGYDEESGKLLVASNIYLDFGAHIPLIRSFSLGNNFPSEVPFFANKGLIYYFMFDLYTGIFEFLGARLDIAYNLLSSVSFTFLMITIYELSLLFFKTKDKIIGYISVLLFLFSSNLSFINFFIKYGFKVSLFSDFWHNSFYFEGRPIPIGENLDISGFWNLNPFINQRPLVFSMVFFFLAVYYLIESKFREKISRSDFFVGLLIGLLPFWHTMIFIACCIILFGFFFIEKKLRKRIFLIFAIIFLISSPQLVLIKLHSTHAIIFDPGFLISHQLDIKNFVIFWLFNLGLTPFMAAYGFFLSKKNTLKVFIVSMLLFIVPNLVHISDRFVFDDHKYLNLWIIFINFFAAYALVYISKLRSVGKPIFLILILLMTLSGYISFMVIKNDVKEKIPDYTKNSLMIWADSHISKDSILVTNGEIYDPMSLIGRKILIGRSHYIFVYGGDPKDAMLKKQILLNGRSKEQIKDIINIEKINYAVFYKNGFAKNILYVNREFYENNFKKVYEDNDGIIYKI